MIDHITHLEDLVLEEGSLGVMRINNILWSIQNGALQLSTKWDGAPSIFAGWDEVGFFVSTKSFLNKISVRYHTLDQIEKGDMPDAKKNKLLYSFQYLKDVVPKGLILQGDLLFIPYNPVSGPMVDRQRNGNARFHPNTLVYEIRAKHWKDWELGVVWHSWIDKSGNVSHPQFGNLLSSDKVLCVDPTMTNYKIEDDIVTAPRDFAQDLDAWYLDKISTDPCIVALIKQAYNHRVREGHSTMDAEWLYDFTKNKLQRDAMSLATQSGRDRRIAKMTEILSVLGHWPQMNKVLRFMDEVRVAKSIIINRLELYQEVKVWVQESDYGLIPAAHEGYVVFGQSETIKIVDRQQFSYQNFSSNFVKGWDAPTRN